MQCIFRLAKCDHKFARFLAIMQEMKIENSLSFGVNYNSVAQKLRILAIKAILDPKNPFLTNSIDDRIKIKAEITSFNMRYYM